jgi:hypothetical protein
VCFSLDFCSPRNKLLGLKLSFSAERLIETLARYASSWPSEPRVDPPDKHHTLPSTISEDGKLTLAMDKLSLAMDDSVLGRPPRKKAGYRMESMFLLSAWTVYVLYYLGSTIREERNWSYS